MNDLRTAAPRAGSRLSVRKLAPAIGAEVVGVDLSQPMDDALFREIEPRGTSGEPVEEFHPAILAPELDDSREPGDIPR